MAVLPIYLEVEDVALGPVLIKLRSMPGIIKLHLALLEGPAASPRQPGAVPKPNIQVTTLAHMAQRNTPLRAAEIAQEAGLVKTSVYGALNQLKEKGIVKSGIGGTWELTAKAHRELGHAVAAAEDDNIKLLPKPRANGKANGKAHKGRAPQGAGWAALRTVLADGPKKRADLITHLEGSEKSVTGILARAQRDKLAKSDGQGIWELTPKGRGQLATEAAGESA